MKQLIFLLITGFILLASTSFAANIERGQDLHDGNCISCHSSMYGDKGNEIYTRPNRKIETLAGLEEQLKRCKNSLGTNWPEDQIQDVQHYLNSTFYHFEE